MIYNKEILVIGGYILIFFAFFIITIMKVKYSKDIIKIFKKVLLSYFLIAISVIIAFSFIYLIIFFIDINKTMDENPSISIQLKQNSNNSKKFNNAIDLLDNKFVYNSNLTNLNLNYLKSKNIFNILLLYFYKTTYFSAITFLTIGYGDIMPLGITKMFVCLEGFLGVSLTSVFTAIAIMKESDDNKKDVILKISNGCKFLYLYNNENEIKDNLIFIERIFFKSQNTVYLIDTEYNISFIKLNCRVDYYTYENWLNNFKFEWNFDKVEKFDKKLFYAFSKYLYDILINSYCDLSINYDFTFNYREFTLENMYNSIKNLESEINSPGKYIDLPTKLSHDIQAAKNCMEYLLKIQVDNKL